MIIYKYNFLIDLKLAYSTIKDYRWLKRKKLIIFLPNPFKMINLFFKRPVGPDIQTDKKIICYWVSCSTWGAYMLPNKIFICPWNIPDIKKIIIHEITHLEHEHEVQGMSHEEKEKYINHKC